MSKKRLHIFRAGRHLPMTGGEIAFSEADVAGMAASYDPALRKAPLVIGHPRVEDDAKGWIRSLAADGPNLRAEPEQVDPAFAEAVRAGRYGALSASFFRPEAPGNPRPGAWYLKHVGFLGAVGPAVLGLEPVDLAAQDEEAVTVEFAALAALLPDSGDPMTDPAPADPAAREAALKAREEALQAREAAFAESRRAARKAEDDALLGDLTQQGRLAPAAREELAAFMATLGAEEVVSFSEGGAAETPRDWFRAFLRRSGEALSFAELSAPRGETPPGQTGKSAAQLEAQARRLVKQAEERGESLSFAAAVRLAEGETR